MKGLSIHSVAAILFLALLFLIFDMYLGYRHLMDLSNETSIKNVFISDAKLGWKPKPSSLGTHRLTGKFDVTYQMDVQGFKYIPNEGEPEFSIYFFGDSYTFGHGVSNKDTFPNIIANNYLDKKIHVFNAGVTSYGIVQMFQYFLNIQEKIKKNDLIIFTPISHNIRRNLKDFDSLGQFIFLKKQLNVVYYPYYEKGILKYLPLDTPLNRLKALLFYARFTGRYFQLIYKLFPRRNTTNESLEMMRIAKTITEKKGARFLLIFLPTPGECVLGRFYETLSDFDYFDIRHYFPSTTNAQKIITINRDDHWNKAGHEIAAKAILSTLIEEGILDRKYIKSKS